MKFSSRCDWSEFAYVCEFCILSLSKQYRLNSPTKSHNPCKQASSGISVVSSGETINNFLENSAQKYPDKKAVWYKDHWMSYSEIEILSNRIANYLKEISEKGFSVVYYGSRRTGKYSQRFNEIGSESLIIYGYTQRIENNPITIQK